MKKIAVLYHAKCFDGFGGAWAAWKALKNDAEYIPVYHQQQPPKNMSGREVYLIDFCYSQQEMNILLKQNKRLVVLDHHISQQSVVVSLPEHSYALDHSGCVLAWKYFHPQKSIPQLLLSIEDNDLYAFKRIGTREFFAFLQLYPFQFSVWDRLVRAFDRPITRKTYQKKGALLLDYKNSVLERLTKEAEEVVFEGIRAFAVNAPYQYSECANLFLKEPFLCHVGISWYYRDHTFRVSLRSDGTVDVSKLAQKYGGGGHRSASGFTYPFKGKFPWKYLNIASL